MLNNQKLQSAKINSTRKPGLDQKAVQKPLTAEGSGSYVVTHQY